MGGGGGLRDWSFIHEVFGEAKIASSVKRRYKKKNNPQAVWEEECEASGVECFVFIHQRDKPEHLKEQDSYLSTDLPSSLSGCLWSPLLLLTLTGFTPPPPKFDCGCRRSLHSNTWVARANGVCACEEKTEQATTIRGNHGDRSYCIIPQHKSTWRKGAPHHSEHAVLPRQNTLIYSWRAPPKSSQQRMEVLFLLSLLILYAWQNFASAVFIFSWIILERRSFNSFLLLFLFFI